MGHSVFGDPLPLQTEVNDKLKRPFVGTTWCGLRP